VGPFGAAEDEADGLLFSLEGAPAGAGSDGPASAGSAARDLLVEATIIDVADIMAGPPSGRDPLRGLRRAVSAHATASETAGERRASGASFSVDPLSDLAEALAELLEGTGASVAVRAPHGAARAAAASPRAAAAAADAFVLRGRFIVIRGAGAEGGGRSGGDDGIIVDPGFREAFRVAPATPGYQRLVESLPATFVGDAGALRRLVALVTAQAARSYEAQGRSIPPWRRYSAMMARWLPPRARYTDTPVSPPGSPLARMGSEEASALAAATANAAARGAFARLAPHSDGLAAAAAAPARVVRGFDLPAVAAAVY
jgi:uncharacterized protein (TIGR01615 family)